MREECARIMPSECFSFAGIRSLLSTLMIARRLDFFDVVGRNFATQFTQKVVAPFELRTFSDA